MKLTYREAYDRIVDAYFKDELDPFDDCACFIGNLLFGDDSWVGCRTTRNLYPPQTSEILLAIRFVNNFGYTPDQITDLELNFLSCIAKYDFNKAKVEAREKPRHEVYKMYRRFDEDTLFLAMSSTLDMLKAIHEDNGEIVDAPVLTKRILQQC